MASMARRAWLTTGTVSALAATGVAWVGEVILAAALVVVGLVAFVVAAFIRPVVAQGHAAFLLALERIRALSEDAKAMKKLDSWWLQAEAHLERAVANAKYATREGADAVQACVAGMVEASFANPKLRRKVSYGVVDRMLVAAGSAAALDDAPASPVSNALEDKLWVELPGVPLSERVALLRRGIPEDAKARERPFDGPVFKRMVREG